MRISVAEAKARSKAVLLTGGTHFRWLAGYDLARRPDLHSFSGYDSVEGNRKLAYPGFELARRESGETSQPGRVAGRTINFSFLHSTVHVFR